jgi:hypothetical protein
VLCSRLLRSSFVNFAGRTDLAALVALNTALCSGAAALGCIVLAQLLRRAPSAPLHWSIEGAFDLSVFGCCFLGVVFVWCSRCSWAQTRATGRWQDWWRPPRAARWCSPGPPSWRACSPRSSINRWRDSCSFFASTTLFRCRPKKKKELARNFAQSVIRQAVAVHFGCGFLSVLMAALFADRSLVVRVFPEYPKSVFLCNDFVFVFHPFAVLRSACFWEVEDCLWLEWRWECLWWCVVCCCLGCS